MSIDKLRTVWFKLARTIIEASKGNASLKKELGETQQEAIFKRTKAGNQVGTGRSETRLPNLKQSYIKSRKYLQRAGKLASDTTPTKSNATKSGEMLSDLENNITSTGTLISLKTVESKEKMQLLEDRRIMDATKKEVDELTKLVKESIVSALLKFKV